MNREKVIKELHDARRYLENKEWSDRGASPHIDAINDAIALLKEQDVKPMIENEIGWNCPSCGMNLIGKTASGYPCDLIDLPEDEPIHFCPKCGQAVKWE